MAIEPRASREIHEICDRIFEETKDMTAEERSAYYSNAAQKMVKKYGLTVVCATTMPQGVDAMKHGWQIS